MIATEHRGSIAILRMAHRRANALDIELCQALQAAFADAAGSPARAVVLTGTGTIFSAGADLFRVLDGGADYVNAFVPALAASLKDLFAFPRPVVAAVNGHAIAGGCILACACDYRLMAAGPGTIGVPELIVGVPFPAMALEILRFAAPGHHLQRLAYTGLTVLPDEALALGLVDEVVAADRLIDRACELADRMAAIPAASFAAAKRAVRRPALERVERFAPTADPDVIDVWRQPETHAVIRAYLDRTVSKKRRAAGAEG
jgi:enoyl-CoA hydratase